MVDKNAGTCNLCPNGFRCRNGKISLCGRGMISAVGETDCQLCPTKFFCPNPMISIPCPDNALALHGATECQFRKNKSRNKRFVEKDDCNDGQYVNENNACADCPNGMIGDGKVCTKCASGQIVERKS